MDKFRKFFMNPNVHGVLAIVAQIAASIPSPWASIIQGVAFTLMSTTVVLPETGSMHREDYANLAETIAKAVKASRS